MASNKPIACGPCRKGKVNTTADIWCNNCDIGLCSTCSGHHKRFKSSRDHKTIDIKCYKQSVRTIKTECDKHDQQLNSYCPSHLMPCCDECILTSHSKCAGIKSLASVVEKTKMEKSKETLYKDINSFIDTLNKMVINKSGNIKRGEKQCDNIKGRIVKFRKKINEHLDKLEQKLCQETDTILNKEKSKASDLITELEGQKGKLDGVKSYLDGVTTHSSKLQSFLCIHQMEQQVHRCQRYVDDLNDNVRTKEFEIKMTQVDEMANTLKKLESIQSLGEVTVVETDLPMNREQDVRREAQVESCDQSNINNITINIGTKIEINIGNWIKDMICLMDGRVIAVMQIGTVSLVTEKGKLQKHFPISGQAISVTQINQDTIAITYPIETVIKIFNMENETVTKVIKLDKVCRGLSFSNNSLAVGLDKDEIRIIDLEGNTLNSIQVKTSTYLYNLIYNNDRVIYSDYYGKAVNCLDRSGKQIWRYTKDLTSPEGLCADTYGNIIVSDYRRRTPFVISKNGEGGKLQITKGNGLDSPQCICLNHNESFGFICNFNATYLVKFKLYYL